MKIFNVFMLILLMSSINFVKAQDNEKDIKAKSILDEISKKNKSYASVKIDFEYKMENKIDKINEKMNGILEVKNDKYHLVLGEQEIFCNGKTVWTYLKSSNEVQINNVPPPNERDEDYIDPTKIFTIWEDNFKYQYAGLKTIDGSKIDIIKLFPLNPAEKNYHTIIVNIDNNKKQVESIVIKGKDGTNFTYKVKKITVNPSLNDDNFNFNKNKYPGVEFIDLRE